jgi:signal transduction histidine kinase
LILSRNNIVLIIVIAGVAVILSIISYQYSTYNANQILNIASDNVRSNAKIQSHDLSTIVEKELDKVTAILKTLSDAPAIHNAEIQRAQDIINIRQEITSDITDEYFWLDKDGKLIWSSKFANNRSLYEQSKDTNLGDQPYFTVPRTTEATYYSSVIKSSEAAPRIYISIPIIGEAANNATTTVFKGVIVAGIRTDILGNFVKDQIPPGFESNVGLIDKNGIILYTSNQTYIGKDYFGGEFQSTLSVLLSPNELAALNDIIMRSLQGSPGTEDITAIGQMTTIAYTPVTIDGEHLLTLYITSPHQLAGSVNLMIDQQRNFNLVIIASIGALAVGAIFFILTWNKRLEETVNARTAELRQANERLKIHDTMQKEFINVAAHELRTPTQAILGYADLIQMQQSTINREEALSRLINNAERLQRLTEDILDVTRIESQTLRLNKEKFDLRDMAVSVLDDYRNRIQNGKRLKLVLLNADKPIFVVADRGRISQVLSNVVSNALKFTKSGTISVSIEEVNNNDNNKTKEFIVSVKDTGTGIDSDVMPRLFTKFVSKSQTGTGLGLFIAKSIIEAHGGRIWAENNKDGKGATFTFTLPIQKKPQQEEQS